MFRISIRELMLLTLVVGLVAGWVIDRSKFLIWQREEEQKDEFAKWQATVLTDYIEKQVPQQFVDKKTYSVRVYGKSTEVSSQYPGGGSSTTYYFPNAP